MNENPYAPLHPLIRLGASSFSHKDWVGPFYPAGTRPNRFLEHYARLFNAVEIDSTYYGIPVASTVERWRDAVPDGFRVAAKFPREIVHGGEDARPDPARILVPEHAYPVRDEFLAALRGLGPKLGPLVLQFPYLGRDLVPSAREFMDRLERFLADLPPEFSYGVEVRNRAWITAALADLCRRRGVALVLVDQAQMPLGDEVERMFDPVTAGFAYIRLLGDHRAMDRMTRTWDREVVDQTPNLKRWAALVGRLLDREVPVHVYVNNHYAGHAPATVRRFQKLLAEVLQMPWDEPAEP